jgi:hypothetical protein
MDRFLSQIELLTPSIARFPQSGSKSDIRCICVCQSLSVHFNKVDCCQPAIHVTSLHRTDTLLRQITNSVGADGNGVALDEIPQCIADRQVTGEPSAAQVSKNTCVSSGERALAVRFEIPSI